jgi:hypothetical protein
VRAVSILQQPRLTSQFSPAGVALNQDNPHLEALMGLYVPMAGPFGRASAGATLADLENLAPAPYGALPNRRFWRRNGTSGGATSPSILTDVCGPYWDYPAARYIRMTGTAAEMQWRPSDFGGHAPGTLMAVAMMTAAPSADNILICFSGNSSNILSVGFALSGTSIARGVIRTNTAVNVNSATLSLNRPYCLIFTTRSNVDHQLVVRDLLTGAVVGASSVTDSGLIGTIPSFHQIGYQTGAADLNFFTTGRLYAAAFWARGMTQAEMYEVAARPFSIVAPSLPRVAGAAGRAASRSLVGYSVFGNGYSVFSKGASK